MDNSKQHGTSAQNFLKNAIANMEGFIKSVETGEGFGLTDEQKKEFQEKFEREGGPDLLRQLNEKKQQLANRKI